MMHHNLLLKQEQATQMGNHQDRMLLLKKGGKTVYFGDLGDNATTMIDYFESNGARRCDSSENP